MQLSKWNLEKILPYLFLLIAIMWFFNYLYINAQYDPGLYLLFEPYYLQAEAIKSNLPLMDIKGSKLGWGIIPELPLTYGILLTPLTFFDLVNAEKINFIINLILLISTLILLQQIFDLKTTQKTLFWSITLILFPIIHCLATGSHALILLFLITLSLYLFYKKRYTTSAIILAFASCIGITPFMLICIFFIHRQLKYCIIFLFAIFVIQIITAWVCGFAQLHNYWVNVFPCLGIKSLFIYNQSVTGYLLRILEHYHINFSWLNLNLFVIIALPCSFIVYCAIKNQLLVKAHCQSSSKSYNQFEIILFEIILFEIGFLMVLINMATPMAWVHHYVWIVLPIAHIIKLSSNTYWGTHDLILMTIAIFFLFIPLEDFRYHPNNIYSLFKSGNILIGSTIILFESGKLHMQLNKMQKAKDKN